MSNYTRQQTGQPSYQYYSRDGTQCPPSEDPADQPKDPGETCEELPKDEPPKLDEPKECPPPPCCCPPGPTTTSNCLDELIAQQAKEITEAERAKTFKAALEALLQKAKVAQQEYTQDKYDKLVKEWLRLDAEIAELIRKLVCAVPCWWCLIECHICPLLYEIRYREQKLWGDGTLYTDVRSLHDLRYWHERNRDAKRRAFERVKGVLAAWEKPGVTIEKVLADNAKLISDAGKFLAPDAAKLVYDIFLRLVPMHLAIAPPASTTWVTSIGKEYTQFCECDTGKPDDCCGPDVGVPTVRERLIGPQPYLIHPNQYFSVLCCLTRERYLPAKDALAQAESDYERVDGEIKQFTTEIDEKLKSVATNARAALPTGVDCDAYTKDGSSKSSA